MCAVCSCACIHQPRELCPLPVSRAPNLPWQPHRRSAQTSATNSEASVRSPLSSPISCTHVNPRCTTVAQPSVSRCAVPRTKRSSTTPVSPARPESATNTVRARTGPQNQHISQGVLCELPYLQATTRARSTTPCATRRAVRARQRDGLLVG